MRSTGENVFPVREKFFPGSGIGCSEKQKDGAGKQRRPRKFKLKKRQCLVVRGGRCAIAAAATRKSDGG